MTGHGQWPSFSTLPNRRFIGTVMPWSISILLQMVRSNSSRMQDCAMWDASAGWPLATGTGRGPQPSSAGGNSAAQPSAKVGMISTEKAEAWSLKTTMATSGLVFAIHSFDFSNPENTRFQYGSSVCLLSMAAPIAGTCDDATPAMILATLRPRFADSLRFGFRFGRGGGFGLAGLAAIAFDRATAGKHHGGVVLLGGPGHHSREMTERVAVGGAQLGGEIDVAAELQHAVVVALEDRL